MQYVTRLKTPNAMSKREPDINADRHQPKPNINNIPIIVIYTRKQCTRNTFGRSSGAIVSANATRTSVAHVVLRPLII